MDLTINQEADELFHAQAHLYKLVYSFVDSMSLKCAVQLGIPDAIHKHNQPIALHELVTALKLHPSKTSHLHRLMRVLVHSGFFVKIKAQENDKEEEGYILTPISMLLLKDKVTDFTPFVQTFLDPAVVTPWHCFGDWFRGNEPTTPFDRTHGMGLWEYCSRNPEFSSLGNEAMASDSKLMSVVVKDLKPIFEGVDSLVDVGGGNGTLVKIISKEFPHLNCTVFDLPQVVNNLPESEKLKYIGGDMFQSIPAADAVLLKWILHDWSDAECIKILKNCREAISSKGRGKVIIIDVVINEKKDDKELTKTKLYFDMLMMTLVTGKERTEEGWAKLFLDAGFSCYKMLATFGIKSLIEVYP